MREAKFDITLHWPSSRPSEPLTHQNPSTRVDFQANEIKSKKDAAITHTQSKLIESIKKQKELDHKLPPGSSIVTSLTGDSAQILHHAREKEREKLREKVVQKFYKEAT